MRTTGLTGTHMFTEAQVLIQSPTPSSPLAPLSFSSQSSCPAPSSTSVHDTDPGMCVEFDATP